MAKVAWHITNPNAKDRIEEAIVFEQSVLEEHLEDGWKLEETYQLTLIDGFECLPDYIERS